MAIWYEVEHSEKGIQNFMNCNWDFHDFSIQHVSYFHESNTAELFLKYDELEGSIILRFVGIHSMNVAIQDDCEYTNYTNYIMGSVLLLLNNGQFLWIDNDEWGDQSANHIEDLKNSSTWIQADRLIWATTDSHGNPTELPKNKIDQVWNIYGKKEHHHFDLVPYNEHE